MMSLYEDNYINELEDGDYYTDIMLKAMSLASNDKYGLYFTSQEAAGVEKELSGEYQGIGIIVLYPENEDYIVVDIDNKNNARIVFDILQNLKIKLQNITI